MERHRTEVGEQPLRSKDPEVAKVEALHPATRKKRFIVKCSCGYQSRWFDRRRDAENDENDHFRLMTM